MRKTFSIISAVLIVLIGVVLMIASVFVSSKLMVPTQTDDTAPPSSVVPLGPDIDDGSVSERNDDLQYEEVTSVELRGNTDTVQNVLLIGIDGRYTENYQARSDTNIILSANSVSETIKMVSLMRDTWVSIPGLDRNGDGNADIDKLNAAFYYGGFPMLSDTIAQNFKLKIDKYIAVDFKAFEKAVDALGGIDVDLTAEEARMIPVHTDDPDRFADNADLQAIGQEAGLYHLNGQQALAYSRLRKIYIDSDFSRQDNQRHVIEQLINKAKTADFASLNAVINVVLPYVQTNMSQQELLNYALQAVGYMGYTIETSYSVPTVFEDFTADFLDSWVGDGLGLQLLDIDDTALRLHQYLYNIEE